MGEGKDLVERQRFFNYTDECHHYTGHQLLVVPWFDEYGAGDDYCVKGWSSGFGAYIAYSRAAPILPIPGLTLMGSPNGDPGPEAHSVHFLTGGRRAPPLPSPSPP